MARAGSPGAKGGSAQLAGPEAFAPVPGEGGFLGPQRRFGRAQELPAGKGGEVPRPVGFLLQLGGDEQAVAAGEGQKALVEGPVAEAAEIDTPRKRFQFN